MQAGGIHGSAMGIQGLQTYLETLVHGGCTFIDIVKEAKKHAAYCPPGTKPTIVVDGLCLIRWLYSRTNDYIFGGPWNYLVHALMGLVRSFQERGIDLVFFFDGTVCGAKVEEWRSRREKKCQEIMKTFEKLRAGCWTGGSNFTCPNGTAHTLCFMVRHLTSCKVFYAVEECDTEVCRFAESHPECFAILGQDSDFAIFNMRVLYLSCLHLDIDRLQTRAYSSEALARHLGLHRELLPLFACLAGNDTVSKEQLKSFHHSLGSAPYSHNRHAYLFEKIAAVIRQKGWRAIPDISMARCIGVDLDLLLKGVHMYDTKEECCVLQAPLGIEQASWYLAFQMYKHAQMPSFVLQVLYGREVFLGETMEQPIGNVPAHICFRSVRQRIYWVLFRGDNSVIITEHVTYPGNVGIRDEAVPCAPLHIEGGVPQLCHLWSEDPSLEFMRWRLFCGCLQMERQIEQLRMLPSSYVVFCCTLHQLFLAGVIGERELCSLILQCILPYEKKHELSKRQIPNSQINADLVSISTYVMIGIQCVTMALSVCGQPSPVQSAAPWLCFDGKLFHLIHRDLSEFQASFPSLLQHNADLLHLYSHLRNVITSR
uniref:Putative constitutive coactivator of peroxisome proliferator-activated receptor gamma n=1 Tax=Rhipicephalus pulchellus TaxID=72859 RepID=L7M248_RHIPC